MLLSIALIMLAGMTLGWICKKIRFPSLFGMIITGIILGPQMLNLIDNSILGISSELRRIALIIILLRAGLTLNINDLKKVGRPAILMCFVPACFEIAGMIILAPALLGVSILDAAIIGSVVAAVSPAVIVPKMIKLIEDGYGTNNGIPQLILAGASVDDIFVIVIFTTFTGLAAGDKISVLNFVNIPISIITGIVAGILIGLLLCVFFTKFHIRDTVKVLIILSISFITVAVEDNYSEIIPFASLIAVMFLGISLKKSKEKTAQRLASKFNKLWIGAEILLFVLVGASVALDSALSAGITAVILIFGVLIFRAAGVFVCLLGTRLNRKERIFCILSYLPKATVQAAIGGLPLSMGLSCGNIVLTVSVLSILITAPLGAFAIDLSYKKCLCKKS